MNGRKVSNLILKSSYPGGHKRREHVQLVSSVEANQTSLIQPNMERLVILVQVVTKFNNKAKWLALLPPNQSLWCMILTVE